MCLFVYGFHDCHKYAIVCSGFATGKYRGCAQISKWLDNCEKVICKTNVAGYDNSIGSEQMSYIAKPHGAPVTDMV